MTDKEKLIKLLEDFEVVYWEDDDSVITSEGDNNVTGHRGYFTKFDFHKDGRFACMGAWD